MTDMPDNCPSIAAKNSGQCSPPTPPPSPPPRRSSPSCMAGQTGLTKVEKVLGSVVSSGVIQVQDLDVGDRVIGIDENGSDADECEVVSVASTGNKTVFGNYTVSTMHFDTF